MGFAILDTCKDRFGEKEGEQMAKSFMHRWFGLMKAQHDGLFEPFIKPCAQEGMMTIHDAVFRAAASLPLSPDGYFVPEQYAAKIREIIAAES